MHWELVRFSETYVIDDGGGVCGCACGSSDHLLQTQFIFNGSEDRQEWMTGCVSSVNIEITYQYKISCFERW